MTKQHFVALAKEISLITDRAARLAAYKAVAEVAARFNPAFDARRFFAACGLN